MLSVNSFDPSAAATSPPAKPVTAAPIPPIIPFPKDPKKSFSLPLVFSLSSPVSLISSFTLSRLFFAFFASLPVSSKASAKSFVSSAESFDSFDISSIVFVCLAIAASFPLIAAFRLFILTCIFCAASEFSPSFCTISVSFFS